MCCASMEKLVVTLLFSVSLVVGLSFAPVYIEKSFSGVQCLEGQFLCADGLKCIPRSWKCDYSPDCSDASDEPADCPDAQCGTFRCNVTGKCLPQGWMCDGEADCGAGDTSDEDNTICGDKDDHWKSSSKDEDDPPPNTSTEHKDSKNSSDKRVILGFDEPQPSTSFEHQEVTVMEVTSEDNRPETPTSNK